MRVLQFASGDLWAGAEVQLFHMAVAMNSKNDLDLTVVLLNSGQLSQLLEKEGVKVIVIDESQYSALSIARQLMAIVKETGPDIIHSHRLKENILGGAVAKLSKIKSIRTAHGDNEFNSSFWDVRDQIIRFADRISAKYFQKNIVCVSDELKIKLEKVYQRSHLHVINNSINVNYVVEHSNKVVDFELDNNVINIGFVGRFVTVKRVELFVKMAKLILRKHSEPQVNFSLFGDGPLYEKVAESFSHEEFGNKIKLFGFVSNTAPYIRQLDYLVFTSLHEGLPMTMLEAMALETAIVSTPLPTLNKVLKGNYAGYFLSSELDELVNEFGEVLKNEGARLEKVKNAKALLEEGFDIRKNVTKYVELYQNVINS